MLAPSYSRRGGRPPRRHYRTVSQVSQVTIPDPADRIIAQGRALVRAIESLATIEPTGPFERALSRLLSSAYSRRLRSSVAVATAGEGEG